MRSQGGVGPEIRGARAQRRQRWDRGGYIQRRVELINKASREGAALGAGREGAVEKGQAGLRRSQLKMQVCGVWVLWTQGPKGVGVRPGGNQREVGELRWARELSTSEGRRVET